MGIDCRLIGLPFTGLWVGTAVLLAAPAVPQETGPPPAAAAATPALPTQPTPPTISHATTYFLEPVDADGYLNYVAALNQTFGHPVLPPEQNAFAGIVQQLDTTDWYEDQRPRFYEQLGLALPAEPPAFTFDYIQHVRRQLPPPPTGDDGQATEPNPWLPMDPPEVVAAEAAYEQALSGPWTPQQLPGIDTWLATLEPPLTAVAAAVRRDHAYTPIIENDPFTGTVMDVMLPHLVSQRQIAKALGIRIHRDLAADRLDAVAGDLVTLRRLAEVSGREPFLISRLVGVSVLQLSQEILPRVLGHPSFAMHHLDPLRTAFENQTPSHLLMESMERFERLTLLEIVGAIRAGDAEFTAGFNVRSTDPAVAIADDQSRPKKEYNYPALATRLLRSEAFDPDRGFRRVNSFWDQQVIARFRQDAPFSRLQYQLDAEVTRRRDASRANLLRLAMLDALGPINSPAVKQEVTDTLVDLILGQFVTSFGGALGREKSVSVKDRLAQIALALAVYRLDHEAYPATLQPLVPDYLRDLLPDPYGGAPLRYQRHPHPGIIGMGYRLYSIGPNLVDDGGTNIEYDFEADITFIVRQPEK